MAAPFIIGFFLVGILLLWILIFTEGAWWLKAGTMVFVLAFSAVFGYGVNNILGFPTQKQVPEKFQVVGVVVRSPNKQAEDEGAIYLWIKSLENQTEAPKSHELPYSRELHKQAGEIQKMLRQGKKVVGERGALAGKKGEGKGKGKGQGKAGQGRGPKGQGKGMGKKGDGSLTKGGDKFKFYVLPPAVLPEKVK